MALDAIPTFPSEYDSTGATNNPPGSDSRRQGDDQIRILKANMNQTWANVSGAVTSSHEELNRLDGVSLTDPIITLPSGTIMLFEAPATAPTGWTKKTDAAYDDVAIRIVTGAQTQAGTHSFSTLFADLAEGATPGVGGHAITVGEMGAHAHGGGSHVHSLNVSSSAGNVNLAGAVTFGGTAGGGNMGFNTFSTVNNNLVGLPTSTVINTNGNDEEHSHTLDNRLKYRDAYFAQKD